MRILGISAFYHDSAAALVEDGRIVAAMQEERWTRVKHDKRWPTMAVEYCLAHANVVPRALDYVVFYERPGLKLDRVAKMVAANWPRSAGMFGAAMVAQLPKLRLARWIARHYGLRRDQVLFVDHHLSHAASAYYCSPYPAAAVLTVDGVGEWTTTAWGHGVGTGLTLSEEIHFPHSLGLLYSAFTDWLGFEVNEGEYKVMGLAAFGTPKYREDVEKVVRFDRDGSFELDLSYFAFHRQVGQTVSAKFVSLFGPPRERDAPFATPGQPDPFGLTGTTLDRNQYYADVAASLQSVLEQVLVRQATHALRRTNTRHLCLAGGVALNSVANTAILQRSGASSLYIQPAAGDAGGALGAALYVQHALVGQAKRQTLTSAALGWSTDLLEDDGALTRLWARENVQAETFATDDRLLTRVVDHLAKGKVIGWMQGRAEFGPRALGASVDSGRPAEGGDAAPREREDQVPRTVPAVRAVGARRVRGGVFWPGERPVAVSCALHALCRARAEAGPAGRGDPCRWQCPAADRRPPGAPALPPAAGDVGARLRDAGAAEHVVQPQWGADREHAARCARDVHPLRPRRAGRGPDGRGEALMGQPRGLRLAVEGQDYRCLRGTGFPVVKAQPTTAAGTRTPVPPQPGPRVACCGCSFTYGVGVEDAESYPARLETLLPQTAVLNFGRRNYGLRLVMEWYRTFAAPLRPKVAVVQLPYVMRQPFPGVQPRQRVHYTANFGATWSVLDCRWRDSWRVMAAMDTLMGRDLRRLEVFVGWLKAQGTVPVVLLYHGAYGILETVQGRLPRSRRGDCCIHSG